MSLLPVAERRGRSIGPIGAGIGRAGLAVLDGTLGATNDPRPKSCGGPWGEDVTPASTAPASEDEEVVPGVAAELTGCRCIRCRALVVDAMLSKNGA